MLAQVEGALISNLMAISWGALAGAFLAPFLYGLFWRKVTKSAVWVSFAVGIGLVVANLFLEIVPGTSAGAISMAVTLVLVPIVSLITPKLSKQHVDACFSCYEEKVLSPVKYSLENSK